MDDYSLASLSDSKNEWCARLINLLTPAIIEGLRSIFLEAWNLCSENDEEDKYLMTFQTFLSRVPKWNDSIIDAERKRIEESTNCGYLEELITCVHIIQLKALTCIRVGTNQKKVDIDIPSSNEFIHRIYTNSARKLYTVVYLFENNIAALQTQKNNRELELIVKECILNSVRDTMPIEAILRAYMDETEEENVTEEIVPVEEVEDASATDASATDASVTDASVTDASATDASATDTSASALDTDSINNATIIKKEPLEIMKEIPSPAAAVAVPVAISEVAPVTASVVGGAPVAASVAGGALAPGVPLSINTSQAGIVPAQVAVPTTENVKFTDTDRAVDTQGTESSIVAPKTDERLERIAAIAAERRKAEEEGQDEDQLTIGDEVKLEISEVNDLNKPTTIIPPILNDIETLT